MKSEKELKEARRKRRRAIAAADAECEKAIEAAWAEYVRAKEEADDE